MFFLLRSAVCISLVVAALPNERGAPASAALGGAERLCRAAPDRCLAVLREGLKVGSAEAFAALAAGRHLPASRDSLSAADRRPAWAGPQVASAD